MTENDDDTFDLSPEEWLIESHNMVLAAFDDLRCAIDGVTADGAPFVPDATFIDTAFGLLASGLDCPVETLAANRDEFIHALENNHENRHIVMRTALDRLCDDIGFAPEPPTVLGTFKLQADPSGDDGS